MTRGPAFAVLALVWLATLAAPSGSLRAAPPERSSTETPPAAAPTAAPTSGPASAPASAPASQPSAREREELARALAQDRQAAGARAASGSAAATPATQPGPAARFLQSLNPEIAVIADFAFAAFSTETPLVAGGHDPARTGFNLQQVELSLAASVDPYFRFDGFIVFGTEGVEVEEAYGTTLALPWNLQARAGQFLTRFGRINAAHPHARAFVNQPLVVGKFLGAEGNRGLGAELSVLLPLPWYVELLGSVTNANGAETARSFLGGADYAVKGPADLEYTAAMKHFVPLGADWSLLFGASGAFGPNATARGNRTEVVGADLYVKYRPITHGSYTVVSLDAEWLLRRRQLPGRTLVDHGLYTYLLYRFARRWSVAGRYEYVTGNPGDDLDPEWTGLRQRASGNLTFWPSEFSRLRLQYDYDRPWWRGSFHAVLLALELVIGAHGAHKF
ncbi:MAG: zinc-regulated TonB-dependent outer membrane receptor [Deltaproteobacteria bacterium]|nr:zinc-regulated TonB-dependent outer membrane receptor [Deltaproteobacteria bacterium]